MRYLAAIIGLFCIGLAPLSGNDTFSSTRLQNFFSEFTCEQKNELNKAGLTPPCTENPWSPVTPIDPLAPPPNPPTPPLMTNYLPIVIVNNSGLHDSEVFIVMTVGSDKFMEFDAAGVGTLQGASPGQATDKYSKSLFDLPTGSTGRVIYLEQDATVQLASGNLWFSLGQSLSITVNAGPAIAQPSAVPSIGNPNSYTPFDFFEITINPQNSPPDVAALFCDLTAVTDFSIPLYGFLSTPAPSTPTNLGFYQPQKYIFSQVATDFANAPESTQWNKLSIMSPANETIRILSTQLSISMNPSSLSPDSFNYEYLNSTSGFNYLSDVLNYYSTNTLTITTPPVPGFGSITYSGNTVIATETIMVTSASNGDMLIDLSEADITFNLFGSNGPTITGSAPASVQVELNKIFTQSIITGLIPTTQDLTKPFLNEPSTRETFYQFNSNLSTTDQTGPWYDLYSKSLHKLADVYTSGYDDEIYDGVQLVSQTIETSGPTPTYIGITIGDTTTQY